MGGALYPEDLPAASVAAAASGAKRERPMLLARVVGTVWATRHDPLVDQLKFLIVRGLKPDGTLQEGLVVAVDAVGAGVGEIVLVAQGSSGRQTEITRNRPVDAVIMAIVDGFEASERDFEAAARDRARALGLQAG
jgi:microcompartment protein CcmK/EutM